MNLVVFVPFFLKNTESYMRCKYGTKKSDFAIMEQEGCDWIGAHKLCGKTNHVIESCRRLESFYDPSVSNFDRESMRCNRFNKLTENGGAISYDEMNELQMTWNKGCVMSPNFQTVRSVFCILYCPNLDSSLFV